MSKWLKRKEFDSLFETKNAEGKNIWVIFEINSPTKGNGSKMVSAVLTDFPKDWKAAVVMDWSGGFWDKMKEKHIEIEWIM